MPHENQTNFYSRYNQTETNIPDPEHTESLAANLIQI
jgi:hypothetical protein